jgi:hypothetical protein
MCGYEFLGVMKNGQKKPPQQQELVSLSMSYYAPFSSD